MTVIINELEQLPATEGRTDVRRSADGETDQNGPGGRASQQAQLLSLILREASRQARLWAD